MSLEAIEKISGAEQRMQEEKAAAAASAKKCVSDAQRDGKALVEAARTRAEEKGKQLMKEAEDRAQQRTAEILEEARKDGEALSTTASEHMEEAVQFIVRRVVNR